MLNLTCAKEIVACYAILVADVKTVRVNFVMPFILIIAKCNVRLCRFRKSPMS